MEINENLLDKNILAPFDKTFRAMGISNYQIVTAIQNFSLPPLDFDTREKLSTEGLPAAENFADEWIELAEPQLYFKYKKHVVIMYQREQLLPKDKYEHHSYRPYHLCFCKALREANQKNRYEGRYVMTYNTSGNFKVNLSVRDVDLTGNVYTLKKEQNIFLPLKVCQHCLYEINWKHFRSYCGGGLEWWRGGNFSMRNKIVNEFNLEEYLMTARQDNFFDHPVFGTASSAISNEYVLSPQIKEALKKIVDYTCDICREQFSSNELQIHHKNHLPGDNRRQNLMVVCEHCHKLIHDAEGGFFSVSKKISTPTINETAHKNSAENLSKTDFKHKKITLAEYATAQKNLGDIYANGWGVSKNESKAQTFYQKAFNAYMTLADAGDIDACYEIANFYKSGIKKGINDVRQQIKGLHTRYQSQADSGDIKAKVRIGLMYAKGLGFVLQNLEKAKEIISSIRNDVKFVDSELIELCLLTNNTDDALKFHAKAVQLWEIVAKNGDKNAPIELARLYSYKDLTGSTFEKIECFNNAVAELEKQSSNYEEQYKFDLATVQKAKVGDVASILELKRLAKNGNSDAKAALAPLYYDGRKENAVGTVVLPEGIISVGGMAFSDYAEKIILPESVTSIGGWAFADCTGLEEIVLPEGLTSISEGAFFSCRSLQKIILPESVTSIGGRAFAYCTRLEEIVMPKNLPSIGKQAFEGCNWGVQKNFCK